MNHLPHLRDLALVASVGVTAALVLARLRLPTVTGLLAGGALVGPFGLALVAEVEAIDALAEVGVVLLLFTIGLELSLARLRFIVRQVVLGGAIQVGVTVLAVAAVATFFGRSWAAGIFLGFLFALSSTAIVLQGLSERGELDAPHGRMIVGALVFQDLCVVPMVLLVPVLAGGSWSGSGIAVVVALTKAAAVVAAAVLGARRGLPRVFARVAASSRDVFILAVIAVLVGTAWLTSLVGLSPALGALLAGLLLAETEHGHRALAEILPLRHLFASLFFVSLGMLFDPRAILERPLLVVAALLAFVLGKGLLATGAALAMGLPARVAWLVGLGLGQFGELGFVLVREGERVGLMSPSLSRSVLTAGIASMFVTPIAARLVPRIASPDQQTSH